MNQRAMMRVLTVALMHGACFTLLGAVAACGGSSSPSSANSNNSTSSATGTSTALVALSSATYTAAPSSSAVLTIDRSDSSTGSVTANYATRNGTAIAGTDYTATSGSVTWNDGDETAKTVSVPVATQTGGKSFSFTLMSVSGQGKLGSPASATIAVSAGSTGTSTATIALSSATDTVAPSSRAVLTIDRSVSSTGSVTANYTTGNGTAIAGTDYTATSGSVIWNDGDETAKTVSVPVAAQAGGKSFSFTLTSVSGQGKLGSPTTATITVSTGTTSGAMSISIQGNRLVDVQGNTLQLRGVNLSGLESGVIFTGGTDFWQSSGFSSRPDFAKIAAWKANAVRLPLNEDSWLGLTVTGIPGNVISLNGPAYQAEVAATVAAANAAGLYVILDLHWTAPATFAANTQNPFLNADNSINFWTSVADAFKNNLAVMFEAFNEPFVCPRSQGVQCSGPAGINANQVLANGGTESYYWGLNTGTYGGAATQVAYTYNTVGYQQVITAIRGTGATNVIICGGNSYDDDLTWWTQYPVTDPLNQLAAALHQYSFSYPYTVASRSSSLERHAGADSREPSAHCDRDGR